MTVQELMELLENFEPEAEVRLATQPNYPLQTTVRGVASSFDLGYDADDNASETNEAGEIVWIVEGSSPSNDSPYAPRAAWDVAQTPS